MTTLAEARAALRRRLEDTTTSPLWDDAALDDALAEGLARYGALVPLEGTATVSVAAGARAFAVSGPGEGAAVRRVLDPAGQIVPRLAEGDDGADRQRWRWWAGQVRLSRPATAGSWTVEWRGARALPASGGEALPVLPGDEAGVALLAAASALRRRAAEEAKRGGRGGEALLALAATWEARGERLLRGGRRRVRGRLAEG